MRKIFQRTILYKNNDVLSFIDIEGIPISRKLINIDIKFLVNNRL